MTPTLAELIAQLDKLHALAIKDRSWYGGTTEFQSEVEHAWPRLSEEMKRLKRANERLREGLEQYKRMARNDLHETAKQALADADRIGRGEE